MRRALAALLLLACEQQQGPVAIEYSAKTCTTEVCKSVCENGRNMKTTPTASLACAFAIACSCVPIIPHPNPPGGAGGATTSGGSANGGSLSSGGSVSYGGSLATGGSSVSGGSSAIVQFPTCDETQKAAPRIRPPMSGWRKDKERAKHRKIRASYELVPGTESVFLSPNVKRALNQLNIGRCTGNAAAQALSTQPFTLLLSEDDADKIYRRATVIDPFPGTYPPTDTGSNGESAWQAAIDLGYTKVKSMPIDSLEELQGALQKAPCIFGTDWYEGFFEPTRCGEMVKSGAVAGGHEIELIGWDKQLTRIWIRNSWGDWGVSRGEETGYAYFSAGTFQKLLNAGAEIDCPSWVP